MEPSAKSPGRRKFLEVIIGAIGGLMGAAVGVPAITYIVGPALKENTATWLRLGAVSKVEIGVPTLFKVTVESQAGWTKSQDELSAYVLTEDGQTYIAMSNICTHLGCRSRWIPEQERFFCPCHNGIFDKHGNVVSGPPPRPLDRFETKLEGGILYIQNNRASG